jgi:large subunit ribosomal protein L28
LSDNRKKSHGGQQCFSLKKAYQKKFDVNLFNKKFYLPHEDRWVNLTVSAAGLRTINKVGIRSAISKAQENGLIANI